MGRFIDILKIYGLIIVLVSTMAISYEFYILTFMRIECCSIVENYWLNFSEFVMTFVGFIIILVMLVMHLIKIFCKRCDV